MFTFSFLCLMTHMHVQSCQTHQLESEVLRRKLHTVRRPFAFHELLALDLLTVSMLWR